MIRAEGAEMHEGTKPLAEQPTSRGAGRGLSQALRTEGIRPAYPWPSGWWWGGILYQKDMALSGLALQITRAELRESCKAGRKRHVRTYRTSTLWDLVQEPAQKESLKNTWFLGEGDLGTHFRMFAGGTGMCRSFI